MVFSILLEHKLQVHSSVMIVMSCHGVLHMLVGPCKAGIDQKPTRSARSEGFRLHPNSRCITGSVISVDPSRCVSPMHHNPHRLLAVRIMEREEASNLLVPTRETLDVTLHRRCAQKCLFLSCSHVAIPPAKDKQSCCGAGPGSPRWTAPMYVQNKQE